MSRGTSGEVAGRLVEEKVGVMAGIVTLLGPEVSLFHNTVRPFPLPEGRSAFSLGLLNLLIELEGRNDVSIAQVRCTSFERCVL